MQFTEKMREHALDLLCETGQVLPTAMALGRRDPRTRLRKHGFIFVRPPSEFGQADRDSYTEAIRRTASASDACAVCFIAEMWLGTPLAYRPNEYVSIAGTPGTREAVWCQLEHEDLFSAAIWIAVFGRDAKGRPVRPTYELVSDGTIVDKANWEGHGGMSGFQGRFVGLLPRKDDGGAQA